MTNYSLWIILAILLAVVVLGAVVYLRRRRRTTPGAPTEWTPGPEGPAALEPPLGPTAGAVAPPGVSPAYLEGPEDVALPPPTTVPSEGAEAPGEPDIDSLMKELDKISGEILKRTGPTKKPSETSSEPASSEDSGEQQ